MAKGKHQLLRFIRKVLTSIPDIVMFFHELSLILNISFRAIGDKLNRLFILTLLFAGLVFCVWECLLGLLVFYLLKLEFSILASLGIVLGLNLSLLVFIGLCLKNEKKKFLRISLQ